MADYTQVFGGENISPAQLSYRAIALSASVTLVWPTLAQAGANVVAKKMDVTPSAASLTITMPDATEVSVGEDAYFFNAGADSFQVLDNAGGAIVTVAVGEAWFIYLRANATAAGTWRALELGAGSSTVDAASLDGLGLEAVAGLLRQTHPIATKNANYTLTANDRAQLIISTGGAITFAFDPAATLGANWFTLVRNDGSGTLTLNPDGSEEIDGATTKALAADESAFIVCDGTAFYTVGYGRSATVTVSAAVISGGGTGALNLSATEVAAQVQQFNGTLTGARQFNYGATVGYWFIYNNLTLAGNTATWRVDAADAGVTSAAVAAGARGILVSNGTNIFLAMASGSGTVTSVATGTGLTGGTITTTGTVSLANTAVTPGAYTYSSLTVDAQGRLTAASSGAAPAPADAQYLTLATNATLTVERVLTAGTGLSFTDAGAGSTLTVALANTAVVAGAYAYATITVDAQGRLTAASANTPVTSITAGTGLSGGTITSTGTIALANTAVTPATYRSATITVDQQGRLTAASTPTGTVIRSVVATIAAATGTTTIPSDDTTPLITEGTELLSQAFTPITSGNTVLIQGVIEVASNNSNNDMILAVFRDSTCIGAGAAVDLAGARPLAFAIHDSPATASEIIYSIRIGGQAGTWYAARGETPILNGMLANNVVTFTELAA